MDHSPEYQRTNQFMRRYQTRRKVFKQSLLGPRNWSRNSAHHYAFQLQSRERNSNISQVLVNRTKRRATYPACGQTEFKKLPSQSRMSKEKKQQLGIYKKYCGTKERKHWKNLRKNTVQYLFNCRNQKKKYPRYSKKYIYMTIQQSTWTNPATSISTGTSIATSRFQKAMKGG